MANDGYYTIHHDPTSREWRWFWVLRSKNHKDIAKSCKGYKDRDACKEAIAIMKHYAASDIQGA